MKALQLFFIFLLFSTTSKAQEFTQNVRGQVIDKSSKLPIEGATVQVDNSEPLISTTTDSKGYFKLVNVPVGRQSFTVVSLSHGSITIPNQEVKSGKELYLEIELEEKIITVEAVKISKKKFTKPENEMITTSNVNLSPKQTERFAGSFNDVARMAMNYAGVISTSDNRNDIIIRGNSPLGVLWRLNGINIPNPNHFGSMGSTGGPITILNNNNLAKSDFMTGAFPADYGNATAGAFDLKLRHGNNEKREYTGMFGFNGLELGVEGPFTKKSKASYIANYRYSTLGIFNALGVSFGVAAVPQYQDLTFDVNLPLGEKRGSLEFFGVGGLSNISILESKRKKTDVSYTQQGTNAYFFSNVGALGAAHMINLTSKSYLRTAVAVSGSSQDIHTDTLNKQLENPGLVYQDKSHEIKYSLTSFINTKFNAKNSWRTGVIADLYDIKYFEKYLRNTTWINRFDFSGQMYLLQAYTQFQHRFTEKIKSTFGVHYQQLTSNGTNAIEPRLGLSWDLSKKKSLALSAGMHSQIQPFNIYLMESYLPDSTKVKTNANVGLTKSNHLVLGYNYFFSANTRVKAEGYYQHVYNTPVQNNSYFSMANFGADFSLPRVDSLVNKGTGKNYGIELTLERNFNKGYYFLFSGSLYDSKYKGGDGIERNTVFNGNYGLNALGGTEFKLTKKTALQIDVKITCAGGKRYIPIHLENSKLANAQVYDLTSIYEKKFKNYFRFDFKVGYRINSKKITQEVSFNIQNVLNTKNVFQQVYDATTQEIKTEYQLGLFPVGSYKIMF